MSEKLANLIVNVEARTNKFGGPIKQAQRDAKAFASAMDSLDSKLASRGKSVFDATRTPMEKYRAELSELKSLHAQGAISANTFGRAIHKAWADVAPKASGSIAQTTKVSDGFAGSLKSLNGTLAMFGAGVGVASLIHGLRSAFDAFTEDEREAKLLDSQILATGHSAELAGSQIRDMASDLQNTTRFADETTVGAAKMLLAFQSIKGSTFQSAVVAAQNLSTILGKDLHSSTLLVGKALESPITGIKALRKVGVVFTADQTAVIKSLVETGKVAEAQGMILDALNDKFGGAAAADAKTYAGSIDVLANKFGELKEAIGGIGPIAIEAISAVNDAFGGSSLEEITTFINQQSGRTERDATGRAKEASAALREAEKMINSGDAEGARKALKRAGNIKQLDPGYDFSGSVKFHMQNLKKLEAEQEGKKGNAMGLAGIGWGGADEFKSMFSQIDELKKRGKAAFDESRNAAEKYKTTIDDLDKLLKIGAIDQDTFNRQKDKAKAELDRASEKKPEELQPQGEQPGDSLARELARRPSTDLPKAIQAGTADFFTASQRGGSGKNPVEKNTETMVKEEEKVNKHLATLNTTMQSLVGQFSVVELA